MKQPTFDRDGYPTDETLDAITNWPASDPEGWIEFVRQTWNHNYGSVNELEIMAKLVTGGWSGNECIISAMKGNYILWSLLWESSHRGGLWVLRKPTPPTPANPSPAPSPAESPSRST